MKRIVYYISDHGFGHAARGIALIRELAQYDNIEIIVKTGCPLNFMKKSLIKFNNIKFNYSNNDVGIKLKKKSLKANLGIMKNEIKNWIDSWDTLTSKEVRFINKNKINLIISDITPWPFIAAMKANVKSIGISNFTWYDIYYNYFSGVNFNKVIKQAYMQADYFLRLPLANKFKIFKRVEDIGLMVRQINLEQVREIRNRIGTGKKIVYIGLGKSVDFEYLNKVNFSKQQGFNFLFSSGSKVKGNNIFKIPNNYMETQNYIAACDYVITKPGWSTIAETIQAKIPLLIVNRDENIEDQITTNNIKDLGIGESLTIEEFEKLKFEEHISTLNNLRNNYVNLEDCYSNSTDEVAKQIIKILG